MSPPLKDRKKKRKKAPGSPIDSHEKEKIQKVVDEGTKPAGSGGPTPVGTPAQSSSREGAPPTITMRDVQVPPPKGSEGTLGSLFMKTGSLDDVLKVGNTWPKIASDLRDAFLPYQRTLPNDDDPTSPEEYVAELCTAYYLHGKEPVTKELGDAEYLRQAKSPSQVPDVVTFLERFMKANGQWSYIENQDWFTKGEYAIGIDINYYPDRSGYKESPVFHKDTGGNNIFVNLIFDNENDIEATEWFADVEQPSKKRADWRTDLLPPSHLAELERARAALRDQAGSDTSVSGGVSKGKYTYVSWVDDLVWHATPADNPRLEYTPEAARASYAALDAQSEGDDFEYLDEQLGLRILGVEILGTMAESGDTELSKWLKKNNLNAQDIDVEVARGAWQELYRGDLGEARFLQDAETRAKSSPWRITGASSEANAEDPRLKGSSSIKETPIGLSTRRRANSLPDTRAEIEKVRAANKDKPRSFLRTWVRILPKDSSEVQNAGLVK